MVSTTSAPRPASPAPDAEAAPAAPPPALPWRRLFAFAAVGVVLACAVVLPPNLRSAQGVVALIAPGVDGPSARVVHADLPGVRLPQGVGHDGQQFYALARRPMHLHAAAADLDRPRYRSQRILFPALAWALHPTGGGRGLVVALVAVGVASLFALALAFGALSWSLGGPVALAVAAPLLPGALSSLNLGVPDTLALAFALAAITLERRGRTTLAVVAGVGAILTKESLLLVLVGYALARRNRPAAAAAAIPAAVAGAWWCALRFLVPATGSDIREFDPLHGLWSSAADWLHGSYRNGLTIALLVVLLAVAAFRRGALRGPLGAALALQLVFLATMSTSVIGIADNLSRAALPAMTLAIIAIVSRPRATPASTR